jgi:hypothetical protein
VTCDGSAKPATVDDAVAWAKRLDPAQAIICTDLNSAIVREHDQFKQLLDALKQPATIVLMLGDYQLACEVREPL